jgi:sortase (surface protein transpeptidase)
MDRENMRRSRMLAAVFVLLATGLTACAEGSSTSSVAVVRPSIRTEADAAPAAREPVPERRERREVIPPSATPWPSETPVPSPTVPPTATPDPFEAAGRPVRLEIPAIGVDSYIETVGLTPDQAMDVPKEWANTGWYELGYRPGELGNAVIAGHLDSSTGGPAVFWDLHMLQAGDEVVVSYENGDRYTFIVQSGELFDHDANGPVIESIFGKSLTPDLNLITCDGAWNRGQATYSHRRVIYTTLAPELTVRANVSRPVE